MNYYRELYLLENTEDKTIHFIYGLTVECEVEEQNKSVQKISLKKKTGKSVFNLLIKKDVLSKDEILQELKESKTFKFKIYNHEISIEMYPRPKVIQPPPEFYRSQGVSEAFTPPESYSGETNLVETYWILNKTDYLVSLIDNGKKLPYEDFKEILRNLISHLKENTRLSFNGAYASRIGNYECFSLPKNLRKGKVGIEWPHNDDKDRNVNKIFVERSEEHLNYNYSVNIVLRNNLDIILDKNLHMGEGQTSVYAKADEPISRYQVKVYDENGDLIFQEGHVLIREISMNMNIMEGNYNIQRPISGIIQKRVKSDQKTTVKEKLDQVTKISHSNPIIVGGYKEDPWNISSSEIRALIVDEIMHKDLNSWWFPTGALEETECFLFLKELLGKTNNSRVVIVDPYFSSFSLASFIPVLENLQAEYTVLTGLFGIDPDTNQESDVDTEKKKFIQLCEENSGFLPAKLTIINAAKSQKPLFHDRYILTYDNEGKQNVYSLSNSLNRAAGLYPMCITKLESSTAEHVSEYVENLLKGHYPDQNGNYQEYKPEEIWSAKKRQQIRLILKNLINENGPEEYYCWDTFWGKLFNLDDKPKLLDKLKKKEIIKKQGDQFIWDIKSENFLEVIEGKSANKISFSDKELSLFVVGLGETLARTASGKKDIDLYVWLDDKKSIYNTKLYTSVSKYYENITSHTYSRQDLSLLALIKSRIFDIDLIRNCLYLFDYPLFSGKTKWGFSYLMDKAIDHDHENIFNWAALKSGFLDFHIQLIKRMRDTGKMPDDIYPYLLRNDSPFIKALVVSSLLKEIDYDSTDYSVDDFIKILQTNDYENTDILWILSSRASSYMLGNTADEEKKKNTEAYLKGLLPLYTDYLSDPQQKNLVSALKNIEIIYVFAKLTANEYQDQGKTLFLWKACVDQFDKKLEEDRFYAGWDINLFLEISGEALINSNPGIPVDQIFLSKYRNNWNSIVDELIIPFSYRDHGFWYKSIGNSIFMLYVGYVVLILDAEVTSSGNKELELYLYDKISKLAGIDMGLKEWPDHTKSGILNRVTNLVTHYYRSYGQIAVKDDINKIIEDIKSALLKKSEENPNG